MPVVPGINKDLSLLTKDFNDRIQQPKHQRNLVLFIVCIALLLDNMLYMVIVPIIPEYLHEINQAKHGGTAAFQHVTNKPPADLVKTSLMVAAIAGPNNKAAPSKIKPEAAAAAAAGVNNNNDDSDDDDDDDEDEQQNSGGGKKTTTTTTTKKSVVINNGRIRNRVSQTTALTTTFVFTKPTPSAMTKEEEDSEDVAVGVLFASKAMIQLLINPFSGAFIDRIGYDIPMCIGLTIIFLSTMTFSFGNSYSVLFLARSLQGVGSAFADTSGLAMIADRFTEEGERSKALGIALAFISFGSLVAPPFGGFLYEYMGRRVPFVILALIALFDGGMLVLVMRPHHIAMQIHQGINNQENKPKGTPIWRLFMDPYIAVCAGALVMANVSLAFLEPTIAIWMRKTMNASESQIGFVWLPGFIPHIAGVVFTVWMSKRYPQYQWVLAAGGLALEGFSCFIIPFCTNYLAIMIPISGICFGIALVDTAILPTLGYLVDVRHTSVYGSIYAIADISYSLAYAFGPVMAGSILHTFGFTALNMGICFSNLLYAPVIFFLRYFYEFKPLESNELSAISNAQSAVGGGGPGFKRFNQNNNNNYDDNDNEFTTIDATPGINYNNNNNNNSSYGSGYQQAVAMAANRPDSAKFQSMQKYPKKQTKNPYKDTHNLIDNMEEDEQDF